MRSIPKALLAVLIVNSFSVQAQNRSVSVISQNNSSVVLDFTLTNYTIVDTVLNPNYNVNQTFSYIDIDDIDYGIIDSIGWPQLPQLTCNVFLPYNATNITIGFVSNSEYSFVVPHQVLPQQEHVIKDTTAVYNFTIDATCYNSSSWIYADQAVLTGEYNVFGAKGVSVTIIPFSYKPSNSLIKACLSGRITISFTIDERIEEPIRRYTEATENYLENFFVNYLARSTNLSRERYLMIADQYFIATLNRFANYKMNAGYDVYIANTDETGTTSNEIITYLQSRYNNINTRPEFVLLAGDVTTIPASIGSDNNENDPISDLNYSRLDGVDYYADVFIGRFPINTNSQLRNIITKTIIMEENLSALTDKVCLIAGDGGNWLNQWWWRKQFEKAHDYVVDNSFIPLGFSWQKLYQPNINQIYNSLFNNPTYFIYAGHGNSFEWAGKSFTLSQESIHNASNTVFPFVFAFACNTGDYSKNECIGEAWINEIDGGSVIYFGSSVSTYNHPDQIIENNIFYNDFTNRNSISSIVNHGKNGYWDSFWAHYNANRRVRYMKSYNLLGDPSLNVNGIDDCFDNYIYYFPEYYYNDQTVQVANVEIRNENDYVIDLGSNVEWKAGEVIKLEPGFHAKTGSSFVAKIESCNGYRDNKSNNNKVNADTYSDGMKNSKITVSENVFNVYPNPIINEVVLSYYVENDDNVNISILNMQGENYTLFSGKKKQGNYSETFSLANLSSGIYVICFKTSQNIHFNKLIKQ